MKNIDALLVMMYPFAIDDNGRISEESINIPSMLAKELGSFKIAIPCYKDTKKYYEINSSPVEITSKLSENEYTGTVTESMQDNMELLLIEQEDFYKSLVEGKDWYVKGQNPIPAIFFAYTLLNYIIKTDYNPDLIICYGWSSGILPAILKKVFAEEPKLKKIKTVFNFFQYLPQASYEPSYFPFTNLPWSTFNLHELEFWGRWNMIKSGLVFSDAIFIFGTTNLSRYLDEKKALGMEGILKLKKERVFTFPCGIGLKNWDSMKDPNLKNNYRFSSIGKKKKNKTELIKEYKMVLPADAPLILVAGSLLPYDKDEHSDKILEVITSLEAGFIFLGKNNRSFLNRHNLSWERSGKVYCIDKWDNDLLHRLLGSVDVLLNPTLFYYNPMFHLAAMLYGTIPVVSDVYSTIEGIQQYYRGSLTGNGFYYKGRNLTSMLSKLISILNILKVKAFKTTLTKNAMSIKHNCKQSVKQMTGVYEYILYGSDESEEE